MEKINTKYAIEIQNLTKVYGNNVKAIKGLNLKIEKGDFFALLGANGAGKSTAIGILTSLVNKTSGSVHIFGHDIDKDFETAKSYIGVVPQEFNFGMFEKVLDIVVNQAGYYGIPRKVALPKAKNILTKLGLGDKLNSVSRTLSGGMKRRLMIARALIHEPQMIILDEPTAGVDVELRQGMWEYLQELNKEKGITILLTTHYLEEVEQLCNNMAIIKQGEVIKSGSVKEIITSLEKETYRIEVDKTKTIDAKEVKLNIIDENTFETTIDKSKSLNAVVSLLDQNQIKVTGIRPKGNRLEDLFLNIIK